MLDYVIENINNYINKKVQMIESSKLEYILKNNLEKYNIYKSMLETLYKAYKFVDIKNYANIESKEGFFEEVEKYIDKETILKNIKKDTSFENLCELQKVIIKDTLGKIINEEYLDNRIKCFYKQTSYGVERIKEGFPVCTRLIREIHKILMQGVRGEYKTPGEFRTSSI